MIADPEGEASERTVLSGSFRAPAAGVAGGTPGDVAETSADGGAAGSAGAGTAAAGDAGATAARSLTLQQTYEGTCDGSTVQWGFFTYRTATPGDSSVLFRVRTAPREAALTQATYLDVSTASAALGTARCSFTGPAPCPIDVYDLLHGAPLAHHPFAQLEVQLSPDADGRIPAVEEWQLTFSCTFNQ